MIRTASIMVLGAALAAPSFAQDRPKDDAVTANDSAIRDIDKFLADKGKPAESEDWRQRMKKPSVVEFDKESDYFWHMRTNKGEIKIRLMPDIAPMHVSSTIYLSRAGFYDGLKFHRVIQGFMAQGGCPIGSGRGGPGYQFGGEFDKKVRHNRPGLLSMANAGPGTDGSQFFLTFVPTPHLDDKHTIFGEIVGGMDTLKALEKGGSPSGKTAEPLTMEQTWIVVAKKAKAEEKGEAKKGADKEKPASKPKGGTGGGQRP